MTDLSIRGSFRTAKDAEVARTTLKELGFEAKLQPSVQRQGEPAPRAVLVTLKNAGTNRFSIPLQLQFMPLRASALPEEYAHTINTGTVVCDEKGRKLLAWKLAAWQANDDLANPVMQPEFHAKFTTNSPFITISVDKCDCVVTKSRVKREKDEFVILEEKVWEGLTKDLPDELSFLLPALAAAIKKASSWYRIKMQWGTTDRDEVKAYTKEGCTETAS